MSKATYPLKLPASVKKAAARLAKEDGVSLNQWIAAAVAQKVGVVETAEEYLKRRAGGASGERLRGFLAAAPDVEPEEQDRIDPKSGPVEPGTTATPTPPPSRRCGGRSTQSR